MDNAIVALKTEGFKSFEKEIYARKLRECVLETINVLVRWSFLFCYKGHRYNGGT